MVRVMNTFGDPVELSEEQARALAQQLKQAAEDAARA